MKKQHRKPSQSTIRKLYAKALTCAHPDCRQPTYKFDSEIQQWVRNSKVAHIRARSEGGPRWDPNQSEEANRASNNLVLLCDEHADRIDLGEHVSKFPIEKLEAWKRLQDEEFNSAIDARYDPDRAAREVSRISFSDQRVVIRDSTVNLGGQGGQAPGAGGGGGGAIGPNARGGDGGGGGEVISKVVNLEELRSRGLETLNFCVGKAGRAGRGPGEIGQDGGDTKLQFVGQDEEVLHEITAKGGKGALSAISKLPEGTEVLSESDSEAGIVLGPMFVCDHGNFAEGNFSMLNGLWFNCFIDSEIREFCWAVCLGCEFLDAEIEIKRGVFVSIFDPNGVEISRVGCIFSSPKFSGAFRFSRYFQIGATAENEGVYKIVAHSSDVKWCEYSVNVRFKS